MSAAAGATAAVYISPDAQSGGAVKFARGGSFPPGPLPQFVALPRLLRAAENLPDASFAVLARAARLDLPAPPDSDALLWRLYGECGGVAGEGKERLGLAGRLAGLVRRLDDALPLDYGKNPFAEFAGDSAEKKFAEKIWDGLPFALRRKKGTVLADLAKKAAADGVKIFAVTDAETTAAEKHFYELCGAEFLPQILPPPVERFLQNYLSADKTPPAASLFLPNYFEAGGETAGETAQLALFAVRRFLQQDEGGGGGGDVGVVVHDRLLARRLRGVAEAAGVLIEDKTGWRAETLSAGAALRSFAEVCTAGVAGGAGVPLRPEVVRGWLSPPFFADESCRAAAEGQWQKRLAGAGASSLNLPENFLQWRQMSPPELANIAAQFAAAQDAAPKMAGAGAWLDWLEKESAAFLAAWKEDAVAADLFARLRRRAAAIVQNEFSGKEFLLWLEHTLAKENCPDSDIAGAVKFVPPNSRRRFSSLLLLGYTDAPAAREQYLNRVEQRAMEAHFGLPNAEREVFCRRRRDFCRHIAGHSRVALVWRRFGESGEEQNPHPLWQALTANVSANISASISENARVKELALPPPSVAEMAAGETKTPAAAEAYIRALPQRLRITAAELLVKCPYLFYAESLLRLEDLEEVADGEISAAAAGSLLHRALRDFSGDSEGVRGAAELEKIWTAAIDRTLRGNRPELNLLAAYWRAGAAKFAAWEAGRRADGWRTAGAERLVEGELKLLAGETIRFAGRIDRLDENEDGGAAEIIDYKSGALPTGKEMAAGEHPQLPLYAYFFAAAAATKAASPAPAAFLCKPVVLGAAGAVKTVASSAPPRRVAARLRSVLRQAAAGAALPANGAEEVCRVCKARGVCRTGGS